jgi:hypothetical protein
MTRLARTKTLAAAFIAFGMTASLASSAHGAAVEVPLGTVESYAILAGTDITKTGPSTVTGDIGVFPGAAISGTGVITQVGAVQAGTPAADIAQQDLVAAYTNAEAQQPRLPITTDLAGQTLKSGVHNSASTIGLNGALTLDAEGNPDAVFVFQAGSSLITGPGSSVNLINGANACNVYWQVGSSATLDTTTSFVGNVMALTSVTLNTGATVNGRILARNGTVSLDSNVITRPTCDTPAVTNPSTPAPSASPSVPSTPAPSSDSPADDAPSDESDTPTDEDTPSSDTPKTTTQITEKPRGPVDTGR